MVLLCGRKSITYIEKRALNTSVTAISRFEANCIIFTVLVHFKEYVLYKANAMSYLPPNSHVVLVRLDPNQVEFCV